MPISPLDRSQIVEPIGLENRPLTVGPILLALFCSLLWGVNSAAVKFSEHEFPPCLMAALRFGLACLCTGTWALLPNGAGLWLTGAQVRMVLGNGVLLFLQIGLFNVGTNWSTSVHSVVLVNVFPFFTAVAAHYWLPGFPLTRGRVIGLVVAFLGVVVMFANELDFPEHRQFHGDLLLLASAALLGVKLTYVKSMLGRIQAVQLVFWEAVIAVPLFLAASLVLEGPGRYGFSLPAFLAILYQGWVVSGFAFLLWAILLTHHSPNDLAALSFTTPIFGMAFGWLVMGESLTTSLVIGSALTIVGIYRVSTS